MFRFRVLGSSFSSFGCFVFDLGCFVFEFWVLRFRDLGVFVFDLGCFVFEIWVLRASVFVFECFVFETTENGTNLSLAAKVTNSVGVSLIRVLLCFLQGQKFFLG